MRRSALLFVLIAACTERPAPRPASPRPPRSTADAAAAAAATLTPADVHAFVENVEQQLLTLSVRSTQADWERSTNITPETEQRSAQANEVLMAFASEAIRMSALYRDVPGVAPDDARKLELLRRSSGLPAPADPVRREELAAIATKMESLYGKAKYCKSAEPSSCRDVEQLGDVLAQSRDYDVLLDAWQGWHAIGKPLKPLFERYVRLANEGAQGIGFRDLGELWRSRYDMPPAAFADEVERLWREVKPLYDALHCHVRKKLRARYGASKVPEHGPIPAHLLGNMWAQDWSNLYRDLEPYPGQGELDVTSALKRQKYDAVRMMKLGESFFSSLGFAALPATFWERSMLRRPEGREVVCHASAWDVNFANDLRIKMCTKINQEDLITIHHELGHIYYYSQYYRLPFLFQDGANDGFHEAIGDAIALSITPAYLERVGLLARVPAGDKGAINQLMQRALDKIAFLPFGKVVDEWRWKVFSGEVKPERYNAAWWELRAQYQGIAPPGPRPADLFDPGAKYHVSANVPYARYFLATVLQYQFHRALCRIAGHEGPLYACSIYGEQEAGEQLRQMLALGASKPWPDALEALTGERRLDATAILDYFAPLREWLAKQNEGESCGW